MRRIAVPGPIWGALLLALAAGGCGEKEASLTGGEQEEERLVETIRIEAPPASMKPGDEVQLTLQAWDDRGEPIQPPEEVVWSSSEERVAEVSPAGVVKAMAPGHAKITASVEDISAVVEIEVVPHAITSLTLAPSAATLRVTEKLVYEVEVRDESGAERDPQDLDWAVSDPELATIEATPGGATITALAPGRVEITTGHEGLGLVGDPADDRQGRGGAPTHDLGRARDSSHRHGIRP